MTEFNNFLEVWTALPSGGTEAQRIKVNGEIYKWNSGVNNWVLFDEAYKLTTLEGDLAVGRNHTVGGDLLVRGKGVVKGDLTVEGHITSAGGGGGSTPGGDYYTKEELEGRIMGKITLTKGLNDYSELDAYNSPLQMGKYALMWQERLVGYLNMYLCWGSYLVQELESFMTKTDNVTSTRTVTRFVRSKPMSSGNWSAWIPYQNSFIGENNVEFDDNSTVPSMKMFKDLKSKVDAGGGGGGTPSGDYYTKEELVGRIMGRIDLTRGTNDYSELDSYSEPDKAGKYTVYASDGRMIGFLNLYCAWKSYVVQELESFKTEGEETSLQYPTRYIRSKTISGGSWTEWTPLQKSFIGENKHIGDEYTVPSMKMFKELNNKTGWATFEFNSSLDGSENIPDGLSSEDVVTSDKIYFSPKYGLFFYKNDSGQYYNNWNGANNYNKTDESDLFNPHKKKAKDGVYFIDGERKQYTYTKDTGLLPTGSASLITKVNAKYDDSGSFAATAEKLLAADYFFAKINFKVSNGKYVRVFFNGDLKADEGASALPITLVGMSIQGKPYRMVATGGTIEIEEIV